MKELRSTFMILHTHTEVHMKAQYITLFFIQNIKEKLGEEFYLFIFEDFIYLFKRERQQGRA